MLMAKAGLRPMYFLDSQIKLRLMIKRGPIIDSGILNSEKFQMP